MASPRNNGQFQPGQSGNPGGRPREVGHVRELARQRTEKAVETLATIMEDAKAPAAARVTAAQALLDRGWGRAPQTLNVGSPSEDIKNLTDEELDAQIAEVEARLPPAQRDLLRAAFGHEAPGDERKGETPAAVLAETPLAALTGAG